MAVALVALLGAIAAAQKVQEYTPASEGHYTFSRVPTSGNAQPLTELKVTNNVVSLERMNAWSTSSEIIQAVRREAGVARTANGSADLVSVGAGSVFLAPVTIGYATFKLVVDSGSSDPWVVTPDYQCYDFYGDKESNSTCGFGIPYDSSQSSTYHVLSNENFNISYADGEHLTGTMGYENFTLAGINVPHQEFGLVDNAAWSGDGTSSGLVGFAYSTLTSAYSGTNPGADNGNGLQLYNTLFTNMWANESVPPVFTLVINRDYGNNGGILALGGVPDVPHTAGYASTPIIPVHASGPNGPVYEFYTINLGGFAFSSSQSAQFNVLGTRGSTKTPVVGNNTQAIVDSGTSLIYVDNATVATPVALGFNPPAVWDDYNGVWSVACDAIAPVFGVVIADKVFYVNGADMILPLGQSECISGVQPGGTGLTILGDVWMKNVLCVFDIGAEMMRFSAREFYELTGTSKAANT